MRHARPLAGAPIDAWPLLLAEDDGSFIGVLWHPDEHFLHPSLRDDVGVRDAQRSHDTFQDTGAVAEGEHRLSTLVRTRGDFFKEDVMWSVFFQELDDPNRFKNALFSERKCRHDDGGNDVTVGVEDGEATV